jgi:hypothetical protein
MLNLILNDSPVLKPGRDGHDGKTAMASSRHRKRSR